MRIVYFGSGAFGLPTLERLCEGHEVAMVVTQPDRPAGRKRVPTPTPVALWAEAKGLEVVKPERVNAPEIVERVRATRADANVVVAFGQKIGQTLIASPRLGAGATMNLHASILPKYRGAAPIHWAILRGETVTGNTVFSLVDRMDAGDVLGTQATVIDPLETTGELHDRLAAMGPELVLEVLTRLEAGEAAPVPQDESQATLAPKLSREDAVVDFTASAEEVRRRVHGLYPWPGVTVYCPGGELKLCRVRAVDGRGTPGDMIAAGVVATGEGALQLLEVQPPGGRVMAWGDFARGQKPQALSRFTGRPPG